MRSILASVLLLSLAACGGSDSAPAANAVEAAAGAAAAVASAPVAAVADAAGGCKDLDAYASAVEAYVAEFEKMNMADPTSAMALQQKAMALSQQAQQLATNPIVRTPLCAPRWASIQGRLEAASARGAAKADELSGKIEGMSACMEKCSQGDPMQMQACIAGCQK